MSTVPADSPEQQLRLEYEQIAQLAGGLAHEIRNPLSTICLNLEVLSEELKEQQTSRDIRLQQRVQAIKKECNHLEQLLNDFLQFARGLELSLEPCELSAIVQEFIGSQRDYAHSQNIEISPHLASGLPQVLLDCTQFRCVLLNLTMNAVQAMPNGGVLEFQTYQQGDSVVLEIIDSGTGIAPKNRERIFELFFSTKSKGSGLGLPTVRKIVESHQGNIVCESEPNRGTRFRITLPLAVT